jgi:hypothetical protein
LPCGISSAGTAGAACWLLPATGTVTVVGGIYSGAPVPLFAAGATYDVLDPDAGVTVTGVVVVAAGYVFVKRFSNFFLKSFE